MEGALLATKPSMAGRDIFLASLAPGDWFGEVPLLDGLPRSYDVRAIAGAEIAVLPEPAFRKIISERPDVSLSIARLVCGRLRMAIDRMETTILAPVPCRLANLLMDLINPPAAGEVRTSLKVSQDVIAKRLGVSRQTVNRQLKIWEREGWLSVKYGLINILDRNQLQEACTPI